MQLQKPRPEGPAQHLAPSIQPRRVLGSKEHEVRVGPHHFLELRYKQLAVIVKQPAMFQELRGDAGSVFRRKVWYSASTPVMGQWLICVHAQPYTTCSGS